MPETTTSRALPIASGKVVAARLWRMLHGRRLRLCGILCLFLVEAATALVFPLVVGSLVDTVIAEHGRGIPAVFWAQLALLVGAALAAGLLAWVGALALARLAETIIAELRETYVTAALDLPRAVIEEAGTGDVVTRASDDIAQVSGTLPQVLPRVAVSVFTIILVTTGLGGLNPWYLAGFALTVPAYALIARWYLRTAPPVYAAERTAESVRGQEVLGTLTALPTVTAHRLERRQLGRISDATWQTVRWAMRARIVQNRLFGRLNVTEGAGLLTVLGIGVWLAAGGAATPGEVTAAALLFLATVGPIQALLFVMDDLQSALAALGRLVGVTDPIALASGDVAGETDVSGDAVVIADGVHFSYRADAPVLRGVNARIGAGEIVAVVGATGSGKSTLAALIAGIHRPTRGRISRMVPHTQVMTVTQETHVFTGTLRENLTLTAPDATDVEVLNALDAVGAGHMIATLPQGLDSVVGHGGHPVTVAQAQHLALARLMLTDPALVILDEATAEAGSTDTARLDHAASVAMDGRAALVIAHRLSQAATADRIILLNDGQIAETGTHTELITADGAYAELWAAWNKGRSDSEGAE